jgi:hypothetical protein
MLWQRYMYGAHWRHHDKLYYDEFPANSKDDAAEYFNDQKRDDVTLVRLERVRPIMVCGDTPIHRLRPSAN